MSSKYKRRKVVNVKSRNNEPTEEIAPNDQESQFILRLPTEYASTVRSIAQSTSAKDRLTIKFHPDGHDGIVTVDGVSLACKLMNLPCVLESLKTVDNNTFYKTADISQILVCTLDGDLDAPTESTETESTKSKTKDNETDKRFLWSHGVTRPLKNTRKRRFRKMAKKKYIESPDVEEQVKRLLSSDAEAVRSRYDVEATEESQETDQHGSPDNSLDFSGHKLGQKAQKTQRDELRELFDELSSSSDEEEDEGQWQRT